jgi:hypothetical protein
MLSISEDVEAARIAALDANRDRSRARLDDGVGDSSENDEVVLSKIGRSPLSMFQL